MLLLMEKDPICDEVRTHWSSLGILGVSYSVVFNLRPFLAILCSSLTVPNLRTLEQLLAEPRIKPLHSRLIFTLICTRAPT